MALFIYFFGFFFMCTSVELMRTLGFVATGGRLDCVSLGIGRLLWKGTARGLPFEVRAAPVGLFFWRTGDADLRRARQEEPSFLDGWFPADSDPDAFSPKGRTFLLSGILGVSTSVLTPILMVAMALMIGVPTPAESMDEYIASDPVLQEILVTSPAPTGEDGEEQYNVAITPKWAVPIAGAWITFEVVGLTTLAADAVFNFEFLEDMPKPRMRSPEERRKELNAPWRKSWAFGFFISHLPFLFLATLNLFPSLPGSDGHRSIHLALKAWKGKSIADGVDVGLGCLSMLIFFGGGAVVVIRFLVRLVTS